MYGSLSSMPAWATDCNNLSSFPVQDRGSKAIPQKTNVSGERRGAIVACVEEQTQLEQIRRGSISTAFNTMQIRSRTPQLQVPVLKSSVAYLESMPSPPSSPKSPSSPLCRHENLVREEEDQTDYNDRRFQRQVMSRLLALGSLYQQENEAKVSEEHKLTPPPSPRPVIHLEFPARLSQRSGQGYSNKRRARSLKLLSTTPTVPSPLPSPLFAHTRTAKGGRRVSAPSTITSSATASHKSSRGSVKKVSTSAGSSRRGSSKGLEILLEGTLFKSGWSWASAYENGNTAAREEAL